MAQRTIHYLFAELLSKKTDITDKNRFLLGSVLPDAYKDHSDRDITHFRQKSGGYAFFDLDGFKEKFGALIPKDDLYKGYYMHLVEDAFYRKYVREKGLPKPESREDVAIMHGDYHILNFYIVNKYGLTFDITKPQDIESEPLLRLAGFDTDGFLCAMKNDFYENTTGVTTFLSKENVDEFLQLYIDAALAELNAITKGKQGMRSADLIYKTNDI